MTAFLVRHGLPGYLGRFDASPGVELARGDAVIVRTGRGIEVGEVLRPAPDIAALPDGELLRPMSADDRQHAADSAVRAEELYASAARLAGDLGLPLAILDAEVLFGGDAAVLHAVRSADCDADPLFARLSAEAGLRVTLLDLTRPPEPAGGCGEPGCGKTAGGGCTTCGTGGGCSTSSCSRGTAKSADEMREHFLRLRGAMEAAGRMPLAAHDGGHDG